VISRHVLLNEEYIMSDNEKKQLVYLSGPMSGIPDYNFPAFHAYAKHLRDRGFDVFNPAEADEKEGRTAENTAWECFLRRDIRALVDCDAIAMIPGWMDSKGATLEHYIAVKLKMDVLDASTCKPLKPESVLEEAERLINGDRAASYGHPYYDFKRTVGAINSMFEHKIKIPFEPEDWALMMILAKTSREINHPKRDNKTDIGGYAGLITKIIEKKEELAKIGIK
jgi:hypothetical protein